MIQISYITPLIGMFKVSPAVKTMLTDDEKKKIFLEALSKGYLIDIHAINEITAKYVKSIDIQYNSTFYKIWSDVTSKTRMELWFDQIAHYITVGLFDDGGYLPNQNPEEPAWTDYIHIKAGTFTTLFNMSMEMLQSGIALKSDTVKYLTDYIIEYYKEYKLSTLNVDSIKNREALVVLCDALNILPKDGNKLFAHIIYKCTGETMIIKNKFLRQLIRQNRDKVEHLLFKLNESQLIALSKVFNRYKPLFIALKTKFSKNNINKISRLSKTHHRPFKRGFMENVLECTDMDRLKEEVKNVSNYKLVTVLQSVRERLLRMVNNVDSMYIIRNNKIFVKENTYTYKNTENLDKIYFICLEQLVENMSKKACKVKLPKEFELMCPTSEKNFIGDIPMGTKCELGKQSVLGIYWRNDWGTNDFDLSVRRIDGQHIGWNSTYYTSDNDVIFSGDITNAPNGANEVILFNTEHDKIPACLAYVNRYCGEPGSKYRIFFGTDNADHFRNADFTNYMVDPNTIKMEAEIKQNDMRENMVGLIIDGTFVFYSLSTGYDRISNAAFRKYRNSKDKNSIDYYDMYNCNFTEKMVKMFKCKADSFISVREVLTKAGFEFVEEDSDIDLTVLDRSTLITLFDK